MKLTEVLDVLQDPYISSSLIAWLSYQLLKGRGLWPKGMTPDEEHAHDLAVELLRFPTVRKAVINKDIYALDRFIREELPSRLTPREKGRLGLYTGTGWAPELKQKVWKHLDRFGDMGIGEK